MSTTIMPVLSRSISSSSSFWTALLRPAACSMIRSFPASLEATALMPRLFNFSLLILATGFLCPSSRWISLRASKAAARPSSSLTASIIRLFRSRPSSKDSSSRPSLSSSSSSSGRMVRTLRRMARSLSISACFLARRSSSSLRASSRSSSARRRASSSISSRALAARMAILCRSISRSDSAASRSASTSSTRLVGRISLMERRSSRVLVASMSSSSTSTVWAAVSESLDISRASFWVWASS